MNTNSESNQYNRYKREYNNNWNTKKDDSHSYSRTRNYHNGNYQSNRYEPYNYSNYPKNDYNSRNYRNHDVKSYSEKEWSDQKIANVYDKLEKSKEVTSVDKDSTNITNSRTIHQKEVETTIINNSQINNILNQSPKDSIQNETYKPILKKNVTFTENTIHHYETEPLVTTQSKINIDIENEEEMVKKNTQKNSKIHKTDEIKNQQFMKTLEELTNRLKGCNYNVGIFHDEYDKKIDELLIEVNKYLEFRGKSPLKMEDDRKWMTSMFEQKLVNFKTEITRDLQTKHFETINRFNLNMNQTSKLIEKSDTLFTNQMNNIEKNQKEMMDNIKKDSLTQNNFIELSKKEFLNQKQSNEKLLKTNDNSLNTIKTLIKETKDEIMSENDKTMEELLKKNNSYIGKVIRSLKTSMDGNITDIKGTIKTFISDFNNVFKDVLQEKHDVMNSQITNSFKELQNNNNMTEIIEKTITLLFKQYMEKEENKNVNSEEMRIQLIDDDNEIMENNNNDISKTNDRETHGILLNSNPLKKLFLSSDDEEIVSDSDKEIESKSNTSLIKSPDYISCLFDKIHQILNIHRSTSGILLTGFEHKLNNSYEYAYTTNDKERIIILHTNIFHFRMDILSNEIRIGGILFISKENGVMTSKLPPNLPKLFHQTNNKTKECYKKMVNRIVILLDLILKDITTKTNYFK